MSKSLPDQLLAQQYTAEQGADIKEREQKALDTLKELELTPAAIIHKQKISEDTFADVVIPYLRDTKYSKDAAVKETVAEESNEASQEVA